MTIIATVCVPEGIAMAADSRLTGQRIISDFEVEHYTMSDNAQKLVLVREETIGISFCGDAIIEGKTVADFLRLFDISMVEENDSVEDVARKLKDYLQDYQQYNVSFFVAGFDNDEPFVYDVDLREMSRYNYKNGQPEYACSWKGQLEAISKLFVGSPPTVLDFDLMPLKDAVDFSHFLVDLTVKYERFKDSIATCGGPIDLLVITKDYTKFVRHKMLNP